MTSFQRKFLALLAGAALALAAGCASVVGAVLGDSISFTVSQLQGQLAQRFPRDYDKLGGLVSFTVLNPRLSIPSGSRRLRLDFDVGMRALGGGMRPAGRFAVSSGLRYDPAQRGLMLEAPALDDVQIASLGSGGNDTARGLLNSWLEDYARDEPVYRFDDGLLQRIAAARIGTTTIGDGVVTLHLDQ